MGAQSLSHVWLCNPTDCSPPGPVHRIFQARILGSVAISLSRGSSPPRDATHVSCISCTGRQTLYHWFTWEAPTSQYAEPSISLQLWSPDLRVYCLTSASSSIKSLLTFHSPALTDLLSNVCYWFLQPSAPTFLPLWELSIFLILKPSKFYMTYSLS